MLRLPDGSTINGSAKIISRGSRPQPRLDRCPPTLPAHSLSLLARPHRSPGGPDAPRNHIRGPTEGARELVR